MTTTNKKPAEKKEHVYIEVVTDYRTSQQGTTFGDLISKVTITGNPGNWQELLIEKQNELKEKEK
jgi:hypothetical protein